MSNLNSRDPKLYQPMVELVSLLLDHGAHADTLATEIAFAEAEQYRTSTALCQAAKEGSCYQRKPENYNLMFNSLLNLTFNWTLKTFWVHGDW